MLRHRGKSALVRIGALALAVVMLGTGTALADDNSQAKDDPNQSPSAQSAAGTESSLADGTRPKSGDDHKAGPPERKNGAGVWSVNTPQVTLSNTVTTSNGQKATLTFEVWEADAAGEPDKKVSIEDNVHGVKVSEYVSSGSVASVTVEPGKLDPNVDYLFRTSAFDGELYELDWSRWEPFLVELPVDLTLPEPDTSSPRPGWFEGEPNTKTEQPLGAPPISSPASVPFGDVEDERCSPVGSGNTLCFGESAGEPSDSEATATDQAEENLLSEQDLSSETTVDIPEVEWCDAFTLGARANRLTHCDRRAIPIVLMDEESGEVIEEITFRFLRALVLDDSASFSEYVSITPERLVPAAFGELEASIVGHTCGEGCTAVTPGPSAWEGEPVWKADDSHTAWVRSPFNWDTGTSGQEYLLKPDVTIGMTVENSDGEGAEYTWSDEPWPQTVGLEYVRCDTKGHNRQHWEDAGCVFLNSPPTYSFNSENYPQAAAHAWLIQNMTPNRPGNRYGGTAGKPMYFMGDENQRDRSRRRICPSGWAVNNGDESALDESDPGLNCDEFAFASTYNSGGMSQAEGGLNEAVPPGGRAPNGRACIQTFAKEHEGDIHLYNIDGMIPDFAEVCGRSAMSGRQNQESMSVFPQFRAAVRLMDSDAYWVDSRMSGDCRYTAGGAPVEPVICEMSTP